MKMLKFSRLRRYTQCKMLKFFAPAVLDTSANTNYQNVIAMVLFTRGNINIFVQKEMYLNIMRAAGEKFLSNLQGIYVEFEALQANIEHDFQCFFSSNKNNKNMIFVSLGSY